MQRLARTTITLPENLLRTAKIAAVHKNKPLSRLITEALEEMLNPSLLGKYSLGIKSKLHRKDLYAEHIKHKMAY